MDLETRFSDLLQPIRSLARNWDVDIAQYLEGYLEDLEKVVVTFNGGQATMNFAEAALLIQGSTCVYSKKVEHLYSLVYQVLDMVANKKKQQKAGSVDAEGNDADAVFPQDTEEEFLLLDDTKHAVPEKLEKRTDPEKESQVQPLTPVNLAVQDEGEKDSAINSVKGEVLGNMSDFQMHCSSVQPEGGIFLDLNLLPLLKSHLRLLASSTPYPHHEKPELEKTDPAMDPPAPEISVGDAADHGFDPVDDNGSDRMDDIPQTEQPQVENLPRRCERKRVQFALQKPKPVLDPWAMLDPFSPGTLPEKKLKVGRTYKLLPGLDLPGTKKRKCKKPEKKKLSPISEFVNSRAGDDANDGDDDQFEPPQIQWDDKMFGSVAVEAFGGEFINSIGSSGSAAATYEELVRRHVENFLASAAKYAQTSEVARRVAEWEEKITPKLEEEEQHDPFDIHEYGTSVLEGLQKNQPVLFRKIVAGKPDYQISRLFLATLQLANVNNVELSCPGELYEGMDKLAVRLLSKKRHHEELAEYRAPSLAATAVS
ncbi:hypothetical protein BaRGS_00022335 [Batillaria attramentaria]|uniref:Condensin-2 complex subunit H2 n=1 Tax=Batillaria attramentaria TaxID=370345 RepID=A0ABD0KHK8_9CAEN